MPSITRTAFITGAGKNIGRAVALDLAGQGINVVINGRADKAACEDVQSVARAKGVRASVVMADVGIAAQAQAAAAAALKEIVRSSPRRPDAPSDSSSW